MSKLQRMKKSVQTIRSALGNTRLSSVNTPYLKIFKIDSFLYFGGFSESIDIFMRQFETRYNGYGNYDYKRLQVVLNNLDESISLRNYRSNRGITFQDENSSVLLLNYLLESDVTVEELVTYGEKITDTRTNGSRISKKEFLEALEYLLKINIDTNDNPQYAIGQIHFSPHNTFLVGTYHVTRVNYVTPDGISFQLNSDEATVLSNFLKSSDSNNLYIKYNQETSVMYFVVNDDILVLHNVSTNIPTRPIEIVNEFTENTSITINTNLLVRYLNIASIFLDSDLDEIQCEVKNGQGMIGENNNNYGDSKGKFDATGVPDFRIKLNLPLLKTILANQRVDSEHESEILINLDEDSAYFEHENGNTYFAIYVEEL